MMNYLQRATGWVICLALLLAGCKKSDTKPVLSVSRSLINATAEGGKEYFEVVANVPWKLSGLLPGMNANPDNGTGNAKVELSFNANIGTDPLKAQLLVTAEGVESKKIEFTQLGSAPSLVVDKASMSESSGLGGDDLITIVSTVGWSLELPANTNWITADKLSGVAGSTKVRITTKENPTGKARTIIVNIKPAVSEALPVSFKLDQAQPEVAITAGEYHGKGGEEIVINGKGFSVIKADVKVRVNGQAAEVKESAFGAIKITVPAKAGDGDIEVQVGSKIGKIGGFRYDWVWNVGTLISGLDQPTRLAVDQGGDVFFISAGVHKVFKIGVTETGSALSLWAGSTQGYADGKGGAAMFNGPMDIEVSNSGEILIADYTNNAIRKIGSDREVTTLLKGGNIVKPKYIDFSGGSLVMAGGEDGTVAVTSPNYSKIEGQYLVNDMVADQQGNIYLPVRGKGHIVKYNLASNTSTVWVGSLNGEQAIKDGIGTEARFLDIRQMAFDDQGNLFVVETDGEIGVVRMISPAGRVTTIAGGNDRGNIQGDGKVARFNFPNGLAIDSEGDLYVGDTWNMSIRKITRM